MKISQLNILIKSFLLIFFLSSAFSCKIDTCAADYILNLNNTNFTNGEIRNPEDYDRYTFSVPSAGWVTIEYQGRSIGYSSFTITNSDQSKTFSNESLYSSEASPETEDVTLALEAGSYVVKVQPGYNSDGGTYAIRGSFEAAGNTESEPNNKFETAVPIAINTTVKGFFSETDDYDFYSFTLNAETNIDVNVVSGTSVSFYVYDKDFKPIKNSTAYGSKESPKSSTISDINLSAGTYYIKCQSYSTGTYQIKWTLAPVPITDIVITGNQKVIAGKTIQLSAMAVPANATNKKIVWESSNTEVATVDFYTGLVTTLTSGSATITAKATDGSNIKKNETIIVTPKQMSKPKVKAGKKKKITISWKTVPGVNQYDIQYAANSKFKKAKTRTYSIYYNKITLKMKKKGTYYVRMRSTNNLFGKKVYGAWSKSVKVKAK